MLPGAGQRPAGWPRDFADIAAGYADPLRPVIHADPPSECSLRY
jgi:hypothetical protein